jgi:hypothetical protein
MDRLSERYLFLLNKLKIMSFACGATCRTFVSSMKTNGGDTEESGDNIDHRFETFHEIIYGKSERGAKERRDFFVPISPIWVVFSLKIGAELDCFVR